MQNVLFFSDDQFGHLLPTFPIAENLLKHGYKVTYVGEDKVVNMAREMGFDTNDFFQVNPDSLSLSKILSGVLDSMMIELKPDLMIATAHTTLEVLAFYHKYGLKTVLVWSHFPINLRFGRASFSPYEQRAREFALGRMKNIEPKELNEMIRLFQDQGMQVRELNDLVEQCKEFSHFITCSKEMYFSKIADRTDEVYLGYKHFIPKLKTVIDTTNIVEVVRQKKQAGKKIIFCSLGTATAEAYVQKAKSFFYRTIEWMSDEQLNEYFMVIVAGDLERELSQRSIPENVSIQKWAPQSELLAEVDLAILHGGMGSIKECISNQVPIMVNPMGRDQFENAKMVSKRGLGLSIDIETLTKPIFIECIQQLEDPHFKDALLNMKNNFIRDADLNKEITYLRDFVGSLSTAF